ncbi:MAG: type IV secretion system DNA-binding domain-containing protein [Candidatus Shapirobacteria bacterium]|nr:type IV secretion system DNA-binding domain-containing protein [Candidatus Shapirobacteria bacterium]
MINEQNLISTFQSWFFSLGIIFVVLVFLTILVYIFLIWWRNRDREKKSLEYVLLQVAVPFDNETKIDVAEQMFASLYSLKKGGFLSFLKLQPHIAFEIVAKYEDIRFYVSVPRNLQDMVEKQINGAYPDAEIIEVPEYNLFSENGRVAFAELELKDSSYKPIKLFKDLPTDTLSSITTALGRMGSEEGAAIQILISPADKKWQSSGYSYIAGVKKTEADPQKAKFKIDAKILEAIENKCSKPGFKTSIRIVVSAPSQQLADSHLNNIKSSFEQLSSNLNRLGKKKIWWRAGFMVDFIYRYQPLFYFRGCRTILNSEELATVFHFPNKQIETPHIFWLYSKRQPAPINIPKEGLFLGKSVYRGSTRSVFLSESDRRRHMYIIGKTGTGKTELLRDLILQDIRAGKGVCLIDPHDLAEDLLQYIPPERAEDVIYFDPSDTERPLGFNLLEAETEQQKHMVTSAIINLMYKLYDPYKTGIIGPRFEHAIRNAMLTVMSEPGSTFIEIVRCLTDTNFVEELLPKVKDPMVRRYWTDQIAQTSDFHKSEVLDYIVSKFGRFVTNMMMRNIIGQSKSAFDFRKVMDEGKILIINLAKGKIGEENSNFLGLLIVPQILAAAMSRANVPEDQRRDFYLYVDEFQNFATPDFAQILSEARKYHLNLTVANQFIGQMDDEIKNAVFGNIGTLMAFRVGVNDASYLQREFQPVFAEDDLLNIERFHLYVKTIVNNEPVPAFSMDVTKDMEAMKKVSNPQVAQMIKELSRLKYGADRELVETAISQRSRL